MKRRIIVLMLASSIFGAACNENSTETTTGDTTVVDRSTENMSTENKPSMNSSFDENASYVNLSTKQPVKVKRSPEYDYLVEYETNAPFDYFFYNPATRDTFNRYGYVVNGYLIQNPDNTYTLDEKRWKVKIDEDGDIKMKDGDDTKIKYDASSGQTKIKTGDTTIKKQ